MTCAGGGGIPSFRLSELSELSSLLISQNELRRSANSDAGNVFAAARGEARTRPIVRGVAGDGSRKTFLGELGVIDGGPRTSLVLILLRRAAFVLAFEGKNGPGISLATTPC